MKMFLTHIVLLGLLSLWSCSKEETNHLTVSTTRIDFIAEGGSATFSLNTDANTWNIDNTGSDWINLSVSSGTSHDAMVSVLVNKKTIAKRSDTLTVTAGNARPVQVIVSQEASEFVHELTIDATELSFKQGGNTATLNLTTTAPQWAITSDAEWLTFDISSGTESFASIKARAEKNEGAEKRFATLTLSASYAPTLTINVSQNGDYYPSYNTSPQDPDPSGVESTATELAAKIHLGWNLGNTLEAIGGETAWGNPKTSQALIDLVKANGFNAVRIPCSWNQYMANSTTAEISASWLARVKEVVQYCVNNDMYAILNIHWDGGWLENNCTAAKQEENNAKQKAFWEQIATHLRDFDEHLIFASANEPNVESAIEMSVLKSYHQTFIDAVRSTGGKNSYRNLVVQGPSTDIEKTNNLMQMPSDAIPNRLMLEVHFYSPYNFCLMNEDASWGNMFYYWGNGYHSETDTDRNATWGEEAFVDEMFALMQAKYVSKGIPVVLGEYAVARRATLTGDNLELHLASRAYYINYVTKQALANGMMPFYWDAGGMGNMGSAIFNRTSNTVFDQMILDAILDAGQQ